MKNEYNILLRIARWVRRFRHRCGYGVHSPFAFDFITGVVYCPDAYYAYESLRRPLEPSISRLDEYDPASGLIAKDLRLLLRITNWAEPGSILLCGASPAVEAHIRAARSSAEITFASAPAPPAPTSGTTTPGGDSVLAYLDSPKALDTLLSRLSAATASCATIIVRGIHGSPADLDRWERLKVSPLSTVSFDLGRFGIAVRRPKLNAQHFVVNYF